MCHDWHLSHRFAGCESVASIIAKSLRFFSYSSWISECAETLQKMSKRQRKLPVGSALNVGSTSPSPLQRRSDQLIELAGSIDALLGLAIFRQRALRFSSSEGFLSFQVTDLLAGRFYHYYSIL
ncbi:MAG: hypothetical protein B9S32_03825 [Verrucomicrobia bacterium Tous-C9LFEB]|nr:MAG: hypothetical protein B9S32_03825 [Verrucomicrobia bacterium Tous-C9LFEB]